jgi:hypothetical protein
MRRTSEDWGRRCDESPTRQPGKLCNSGAPRRLGWRVCAGRLLGQRRRFRGAFLARFPFMALTMARC